MRKKRSWHLAGVLAVVALVALAADVGGATCKLELKKPGDVKPVLVNGEYVQPIESLFGSTQSQRFSIRVGGPQGARARAAQQGIPEFSEVITKELDKYQSEKPLRGVVKLGTEYYGFVLDTEPPKPKPEKKEAEAKDEKKEEKKAEKKSGSVAKRSIASSGRRVVLMDGGLVFLNGDEGEQTEVPPYTRLYLDLNHNGDLTDDKVIEADTSADSRRRVYRSYAYYTFPVMTVPIEVDGAKADYMFRMSVSVNARGEQIYANGSVQAAGYREGQITLDGQEYRVVAIDFNGNGRFDDTTSMRTAGSPTRRYIRPDLGDLLFLVKPDSRVSYGSVYSPSTQQTEHLVGKHLNVKGRLYEMKLSPVGDELTLVPVEGARGFVTNPNEGYQAVVYNDEMGPLKISGDASGKAELPPGDWKLYSYTIDRTTPPKAEEKAEADTASEKTDEAKSEEKKAKKVIRPRRARPTDTMVYARAMPEYNAVTVAEGETVEMPFGPPFQPIVTASYNKKNNRASLGMKLVGAGGESCSGLVLKGNRPDKPTFTVTTPDGTEVAKGNFEYG
ncbi:MAG: hypothetical protein JW818_03220 [Pirellulales bacterium]|nr:hypothetical protein [Pirellulales bacterium]